MTTLWEPDEAFSKRHRHGYNFQHVERFISNVNRRLKIEHDIVVLVDQHWMDLIIGAEPDTPSNVTFVEAPDPVGGWSRVMECYNPELRAELGIERGCWAGLDTVFMKDWSDILMADIPVGLPKDPYHKGQVCNAVTTFTREGADLMWNRYQQRVIETRDWWEGSLLAGQFSEMNFQRLLWKEQGWTTLSHLFPGKLISYKAHFKTNKCALNGASIVYFHGTPKMWDLPVDDPVAAEWLRND